MDNEFETMCKRLDKCNKGCVANKYICAERAVKEYVGDDKKKLLQLKAQAMEKDFYLYSAFVLAVTAILVSCIDAAMGPWTGLEIDPFLHVLIKILLIFVPVIIYFMKLYKYAKTLGWRQYILVAIAEQEKI